MTQGRFGGPQKRRSPRYDKRFKVSLECEGITHEVRTINISRHGIQLPRRNPPPVGSHVKLTVTIRGETSIFEGDCAKAYSLPCKRNTNNFYRD
jgi:hypothetical protein